jgi:hypothetical protein
MAVLVSSLFASSVLADDGITASGERYTDAKGNDLKTVSVEFKGIPAEYEGWQATMSESMPVCGVVTGGVVSCEFRREDKVMGAWLHLYKGTETASFYVDFYVPGMKKVEPKPEVNECEQLFGVFSLFTAIPICNPT